MKTKRERTAYHEAGHAVMAHLERRPIRTLTIHPHETSLGRMRYSSGLTSQIDDMTPRNRQLIESALKISFAGLIAEWIYSGRKNWAGAEKDLQSMAATASYVHSSKEVLDAYIHYLFLLTRATLKSPPNWMLVKGLADRLLAVTSIPGRQVKATIRDIALASIKRS